MRKVVVVVVALGIVIAIYWFTRANKTTDARPPAVATASGSASPAAPPAKIDTSKARRLSKADRAALGAQITAAREKARAAAAAATSSTQPPALPDDTIRLADVAAPLREALRDTGALLADCYGNRPGGATANALMRLSTDPELGTVVDANTVTDEAGEPLEPELESCLRDTIDTVALPPLGSKSGTVPVMYSFHF